MNVRGRTKSSDYTPSSLIRRYRDPNVLNKFQATGSTGCIVTIRNTFPIRFFAGYLFPERKCVNGRGAFRKTLSSFSNIFILIFIL